MPSFRLFLRAEYGLLNYNTNFIYSLDVNREWVHYPMVGGGILLPIGQTGGVSIQLMWDLVEKEFSIYGQNPIFRMGVMFGL
jgi:hypothetical protein